VLRDARLCTRHASAAGASLSTTGLEAVVHAPAGLRAGTRAGDRALEGLLSYAAELGTRQVVYHAQALPDAPESEDGLLFEARSLAALARAAERLELTIAVENLCPLYPGPETVAASPLSLRGLVQRIGSRGLGLCLDVGHAHVIADLRHTHAAHLAEPVLDAVTLFHVHDNLGARWRSHPTEGSGVDPLRLDLHLPPGRGTLGWEEIAPLLADHTAPLVLEVHPPHRPRAAELFRGARDQLLRPQAAPV
jgi:sugar phosphate isomerase/epimerase